MKRLIGLGMLAIGLAGCSSSEVRVPHSVPLLSPQVSYAEQTLLDVGVVLFDSGVPEGEIDRDLLEELLQDGTFVQIRRAEAMMMPVVLSETLQSSGHWGSVWVTPRESTAADLTVTAEILESDGNVVHLHVNARDATGRVWLDDDYEMETAASAYNRQRYPNLDPYQDVFNRIANDLAAVRAGFTAEDIAEIRRIAELRYAAELSPEAFDGYIEQQGDGQFETVRLPASGDPMFERTRSVRLREQLFFETLDQYYEDFMVEAEDSYNGWREFSREDSIRIREAARAAKTRTAFGALAIALSIAYGNETGRDSLADRVIADAGIYIGADLLRAGAMRRQERRLYTSSLRELSESFEDDVKPLVVEIQGTEHRLTGTAEAQYGEWRQLLRELFISETGFVPEEIDVYTDPLPDGATSPDSAANPPSASEAEETRDAGGGTEADA
jgi:hypothetical protein